MIEQEKLVKKWSNFVMNIIIKKIEGFHNVGNIDIQCQYCNTLQCMDEQTMPLIKLNL